MQRGSSMRQFQPGAIVRGENGEAYIVLDNYGDCATAVRSVEITNPSEWLIIQEGVPERRGAAEGQARLRARSDGGEAAVSEDIVPAREGAEG